MMNNQRRFKLHIKSATMLLHIFLITMGALKTTPLHADEKKQSSNYNTLIHKVQESLKKNQFLEAMKFADQAIEKDSTQYEAFSLLAIAATQLKQKDIAETAINQAVELANRDQRLKLFPIWQKIDPEGAKLAAQVRAEKGAAAYADGLAFQAAQQFEEAWRINPEKTAWGLQSARAYLEIKKYLPGIPLLREAALSPDDKVAAEADQQLQQISALIATIYKERMENAAQKFKADDMVAAENNWMEAIEVNPFRPDAYYELSKFYLEQDEQEQALKALRQAIRHGDRDPKRVLNKAAFMRLWNHSVYLELIEGMYGPSERKRITEEYQTELKLEDPDYDLGLNLYLGDGVEIDESRAYKLFRKAADRGHTLAKTFVGDYFFKGELGFRKDREEASHWYQSARPALTILANQDNPVAQVQYGRMYELGIGVKKNAPEAIKWYRKAAEKGDAQAQCALGQSYMEGEGVAQNKVTAFKWYRKAAEQGLARGQMFLGYRYYHGKGTVQNYVEALKWWSKAAEQGQVESQHNLGWMYSSGEGVTRDLVESSKWYRKAAERNFLLSQFALAKIYAQGKGVNRDQAEAFKWYLKAAKQGHLDAQNNLGICYSKGEGVSPNDAEAVKWYRRAAEEGHAWAQNNLGFKYQKGEGVERNFYSAVKWFRKAAEQGNPESQNMLGVSYANGEGVAQSEVEAVKWYRKAAEQGYAVAQNNLGVCYGKGTGVTQNYTLSVKWYRKAAEQGHAWAQNNLGYRYKNGQGVAKNDAEAVKWFKKAVQGTDAAAAKSARKGLKSMGYTP